MPAPQYVVRSYGGGADVAQLTREMGPSDTSFSITPTTGWLQDDGNVLGTDGPFTVVVDRFTASVEKILCATVNPSTGVVNVYVDNADGWSGRGYDGTAPQAHVPGGSTAGVQTCWSSAEAQEANRAVYDVLGGGSSSLVGVPIGSSVPFNGTPLTLPANFLVENGSAVSRTTYSACFTALTIAATGTTTNGGATITGVSSVITPYIQAGMKVTVVASGGAIYTVSSVTSTTVVLTSGTGITAATAGAFIVYPHGAGNGSTTFNLPDSRGRSKVGQGAVNTNAQPTQYVGQVIGTQTVTISQAQLPTTIGTAAAQIDSGHFHTIAPWNNNPASGNYYGTADAGVGGQSVTLSGPDTLHFNAYSGGLEPLSGTGTAQLSASAVTNAGGGNALNVESPGIGCTWIIRVL